MQSNAAFESQLRETLRSLFGSLPDTYAERSDALKLTRHVLQDEIARALERTFNAQVAAMPQDDLAGKRAVCSWANEQAQRLGLAIRCPSTGRPSTLVAVPSGGREDGRIRLQSRDASGTLVRTNSFRSLPRLDLVEDAIRDEPFSAQYRRRRDSHGRVPE